MDVKTNLVTQEAFVAGEEPGAEVTETPVTEKEPGAEEAPAEEEEDWNVKEFKDKCKALGLSDK